MKSEQDLPPSLTGGATVADVTPRRRRRPNQSLDTSDIGSTSGTFAPISPPEGAAGARLTLPLTTEGRIDVGRMRDRTRDQFAAALADPAVSAALSRTPGASAAPLFSDTAITQLYDLVSHLAVTAATRAGYPAEVASFAALNEDDKRALVGPTGKVLAKYCPSGGPYQAEIQLALAVGTVVLTKVMFLRALTQMDAEQFTRVVQALAARGNGAGVPQ